MRWLECAVIEVEAEDIQEAIDYACGCEFPDGEYIEDSFEIEYDNIKYDNEDIWDGIVKDEIDKINSSDLEKLSKIKYKFFTNEGRKRAIERISELQDQISNVTDVIGYSGSIYDKKA